jgi:glycosyltransferase involved in cell wall biosynthesis
MRRAARTTKPQPLMKDALIQEASLRPVPKKRPWHVIHACDYAREITNVIEAQLSVGMLPYVVTARSDPRKVSEDSASLMQAWQCIRTWRKQLDECGAPLASWPLDSTAILHAHSFAAGMAAVRGEVPAVYDLRSFIEEQADSGQAWLSRSFRTAEQFVLTRAKAVVVHAGSTRALCLERGVDAENVFMVPDPVPVLPPPDPHSIGDSRWLHNIFGFSEDEAVAVVTKVDDSLQHSSGKQSPNRRQRKASNVMHAEELVALLQAFAQAHSEHERAKLFVISDSSGQYIRKLGRELNLDHAIFVISHVDADRALMSADIVLDTVLDDRTGAAGSVALGALAHGRALLAADLPSNRDVTPDGRGCLWYKPSDKRDLANRLAFLARNRDFRKALGDSGRKHILETRSPERVGRRYAEVYRYAHQRRKKRGDPRDLSASLIPTRACL